MRMRSFTEHAKSERGAVLVHVAVALIGLTALSTFVIDYGVLWAARRHAQNAADAAAMAGAVSLAFVDKDNHPLAIESARRVAAQNLIWGEAPNAGTVDVSVPFVCPPGSPGAGTSLCIRVDVYRNQQRANVLPTFFGKLAGVEEQGVKATATAQVMYGSVPECVKPFAIPDKWIDDGDGVFEPGTDIYEPPPGTTYTPYGTGYTPVDSVAGGSDYGTYVILKMQSPQNSVRPGWFQPIQLTCPGGNCYRDAIRGCVPMEIELGETINADAEPGNMIGPTNQGIDELVAMDPHAQWDPIEKAITGSCMETSSCPGPNPSISPRLLAIPVYDPYVFATADGNGRNLPLSITKIVGFFLDKRQGGGGGGGGKNGGGGGGQGNDIGGWLTWYPTVAREGDGTSEEVSFIVTIALVR